LSVKCPSKKIALDGGRLDLDQLPYDLAYRAGTVFFSVSMNPNPRQVQTNYMLTTWRESSCRMKRAICKTAGGIVHLAGLSLTSFGKMAASGIVDRTSFFSDYGDRKHR